MLSSFSRSVSTSSQQPMSRGGEGGLMGGSHRWVVSRGLASELVAECGSLTVVSYAYRVKDLNITYPHYGYSQ